MMNAKRTASAAILLLSVGAVTQPCIAAPTWGTLAAYSVDATVANGVEGALSLIDHADGAVTNRGIFQPLRDYQGSSSVSSRGVITSQVVGLRTLAQAADASASVEVTMGGLRATAGADNNVSTYFGRPTGAQGLATSGGSWLDTLTFHTSNPLGSDYTVSVTLDDSLSTSLAPSVITNGSPYYIAQSASLASARTDFELRDAGESRVAGLVINDQLLEDLSHFDPITGLPTLSQSPPPSRTLTATFHIFDGTVLTFTQDLELHANVNYGNGTAGANAQDTAYFDLSTTDALASYSADSGTVYATAGDPFAAGVSPVPEPSEWALLLGGFGLFATARRRRRGS